MALITHADYYEFADLTSPVTEESRIDDAIADAESFVETYLSRAIAVNNPSPIEAIEIFSGRDQIFYWSKQVPISSVVKIEYWNGTNWIDVVAVDGHTICFDAISGKVWFEERCAFFKGRYNWRMTYNYGYAVLPSDFKRALCILTKHFIQQADFMGLKSQSDGEQNFSYDTTIPSLAIQILNYYKRFTS